MGSVHRIDRPKPWQAKYRGPDGRQHSRSFHRKVDAERWIRDEESKIDRAAWIDPRGGAIPFADYAETWLDGLHELKPKTVNEYRWHLTSRVLPTFGDKRLRSINPATVREWQNRLLGNGLSTGTVRQSRGVLSLILNQAVNDGLLVRNPCEKVKPPTVRPRRQLFLTSDQLASLAVECGDYAPFVWFLGWSGLRLGEAVALRVGRVNPPGVGCGWRSPQLRYVGGSCSALRKLTNRELSLFPTSSWTVSSLFWSIRIPTTSSSPHRGAARCAPTTFAAVCSIRRWNDWESPTSCHMISGIQRRLWPSPRERPSRPSSECLGMLRRRSLWTSTGAFSRRTWKLWPTRSRSDTAERLTASELFRLRP